MERGVSEILSNEYALLPIRLRPLSTHWVLFVEGQNVLFRGLPARRDVRPNHHVDMEPDGSFRHIRETKKYNNTVLRNCR